MSQILRLIAMGDAVITARHSFSSWEIMHTSGFPYAWRSIPAVNFFDHICLSYVGMKVSLRSHHVEGKMYDPCGETRACPSLQSRISTYMQRRASLTGGAITCTCTLAMQFLAPTTWSVSDVCSCIFFKEIEQNSLISAFPLTAVDFTCSQAHPQSITLVNVLWGCAPSFLESRVASVASHGTCSAPLASFFCEHHPLREEIELEIVQ